MLHQHAESYLEWLRLTGRSKRYARSTQLHLAYFLDPNPDLTPVGVRKALRAGLAAGWAGSTIANYAGSLRRFVHYLDRINYRIADPLEGVTFKRSQTLRRRALPPRVFWRFVAKVRDCTDRRFSLDGPGRAATYAVAASTGLRAAELRSICWESVEFTGRGCRIYLHGDHAKNRKPFLAEFNGAATRLLKSVRHGRPRPFPLPAAASTMIKADCRRQGIEHLDGSGRIFDFHALRSQFAEFLIRSGAGLGETHRRMRHRDIRTTARHYMGDSDE